MLVDEKELDLVELHRLPQTDNEGVHHIPVDIALGNVFEVQINRYLEGVSEDRSLEELDDLLLRDRLQIYVHEVSYIVIFTVHFQHQVQGFTRGEETLPEILGNSGLRKVVNQ